MALLGTLQTLGSFVINLFVCLIKPFVKKADCLSLVSLVARPYVKSGKTLQFTFLNLRKRERVALVNNQRNCFRKRNKHRNTHGMVKKRQINRGEIDIDIGIESVKRWRVLTEFSTINIFTIVMIVMMIIKVTPQNGASL